MRNKPSSSLHNPIQFPPTPIQPSSPLPHLIRILVISLLQLLANTAHTLDNTKDKRFVFQSQRAPVGVEDGVDSDCCGILQGRRRDEWAEQGL